MDDCKANELERKKARGRVLTSLKMSRMDIARVRGFRMALVLGEMIDNGITQTHKRVFLKKYPKSTSLK